MKMTVLEKKLLEKLDSGLLDGFLPGDIKWSSDGVICRRMILRGIPYFICFMPKPDYGNTTFTVAQHYETDEMRLLFLKRHGDDIEDPDVKEYSNTSRN